MRSRYDVAWVVCKNFHLAADGVSHSKIARVLNEEGVPTRYMYHKIKGDKFPDKQPYVKIKVWDDTMIKNIITDETYLGTLLWNRAKCGMDTNKKRVEQPREKWIVVENQHEALVTKEIFDKANENIVGRDMSKRKVGKKNIFFSCGCCGRGLKLMNGKNGNYYCNSRTWQLENDCQKVNVNHNELENAVLCQVKKMADMLIEARTIRKNASGNDRKTVLETTLADSAKEMAHWKDTKVRLYEQYKAGTITRENYVAQIEEGRTRMVELEQIRSAALSELDNMQAATNTEEISDNELAELSVLEAFDKEKLKVLIDKVIVYGADTVEIVWKVDNPFEDKLLA